ncbi:MAG: flagellar basal body rod protein FlgF [Gammaproteobacteria bacterium]|nr:flagellar basal body rod protein FlgF [Gammaproteobacteria bacterium]
MDRMLYVAMNGAKQNMLAQTANTNNLANVSTPGFRADYASFRSMPVFGLGHPTRVYSMAERPGIDLNPGGLNTTGNPLDVAVDGDGYIAVQAKDGNEAFTRAGNLRITATGLMITAGGEPVLGNAGPISLPPASKIDIAKDGTISIIPMGQPNDEMEVVGRIKLVNPPAGEIYKGNDGLLRIKDGSTAVANANVSLISGALESSNVNIAEALVNMIDSAREFELHVKLMKTADEHADKEMQFVRLG